MLSRSEAKLPFRVFVPLDGSQLAETALVPAAHVAAALAAPNRGAVHVTHVLKLYPTTAEGSFVSEFNEGVLECAKGL